MRLRLPPAPPSDSPLWKAWEVFTRVHLGAYRLTGGAGPIGRIGGARFLLLHHLIVASKGGTDRHPAWLHNLRAHPETLVEIGRDKRRVRAREASDAERDAYWPRLDAIYPDYAAYRRRAGERRIPLVVLEPA